MPPSQEQQQVLELLVKNEEAMQSLYQFFAQKYPEHQQFWQHIAQEETHHASIIRTCPKKLQEESSGHLNTIKQAWEKAKAASSNPNV